MSTNSNPGQQPEANNSYGGYGGYSGYRPAKPSDDPYGAAAGPTPEPGTGTTGTGSAQSDPNYVYGQQGRQSAYGQQQQQQYAYGQPGQQSGAYVPPSSVSGRSSYGQAAPLDEQSRLQAFYSYLGICFTGIFFFFTQRRNSYVRFHAAQSVVLFTPLVATYILLRILTVIPVLGVLLGPILGCLTSIVLIGGGILWIFLMVQSYRGVSIRLPIVSQYADALIARFSRGRTP